MSGDLHTAANVVAELRRACAGRGGQAAFARRAGVPESIVSMVLNGHRDVPEAIANALGFVETRAFRRIKGNGNG